ncbi:hypothetical protein AC249_AIPGENE13742 [Exaiptasia diaphana]|nr:hypothetical protein AC249_AIPGENE13742 [Exaiptasia diaphana]
MGTSEVFFTDIEARTPYSTLWRLDSSWCRFDSSCNCYNWVFGSHQCVSWRTMRVDKCMTSTERDYYIALFSIIGGTFVVIVMSVFGSWASCKDKCYCCGAEDRNYNVNSVRGRTNILPMSSTNVGYY